MILFKQDMGIKLKSKKTLFVILFVLLLSAYVTYCYFRPIAFLSPSIGNDYSKDIVVNNFNIKWPTNTEVALSVQGMPFSLSNGSFNPSPTASVAKLITSLVVLDKYPLELNQQGPNITINQSDEDIYKNYVSQGGSVTYVTLGEKLSEYQMLESLMLPSSDNCADTLAIWAYGSLKEYKIAATNFINKNGLSGTTIGSDASGLAPDTVSTPQDLIKLGNLAISNPVLKQIVALKSVNLPVAGVKNNYNGLLGTLGINGIKTGNTDQAGGVLVTSSDLKVNDKNLTLLSSVMKTKSLSDALNSTKDIISQFINNFKNNYNLDTLLSSITYKTQWDNKVINIKTDNIEYPTVLNSSKIHISIKLKNINQNAKSGDYMGTLTLNTEIPLTSRIYNVYLNEDLSKPSLWWLLTHP